MATCWTFRHVSPRRVDSIIRTVQLASAAPALARAWHQRSAEERGDHRRAPRLGHRDVRVAGRGAAAPGPSRARPGDALGGHLGQERDCFRHALRPLAHRVHDGEPHRPPATSTRERRRDGRRLHDPRGHNVRHPGEHRPHHTPARSWGWGRPNGGARYDGGWPVAWSVGDQDDSRSAEDLGALPAARRPYGRGVGRATTATGWPVRGDAAGTGPRRARRYG